MPRRRWHGRWSIGTIVIRLILVYPFPVLLIKKSGCVQLVSGCRLGIGKQNKQALILQ